MSFLRLLFFLALMVAGTASAQQRIAPSRVAVLGSYWFGSPLTFDRASPILKSSGSSGIGLSRDHSFGLGFEIGYDISDRLRFLFQLGGRLGQGKFESEAFLLSDTLRTFTITTSYMAVDLGPLASLRITPWLDFLGGTTLTFYPTSSAAQLWHTTGIAKIDTTAQGDTLLSKPIHVSIPLGARLTLVESNAFSFGLDLLAAINMTEAIRGYTSQAFRFGSTLWLDFGGTSRIEDTDRVSIDTIFTPIKPRVSASARFVVNGTDRSSIQVTTIDTIRTSSESIPQYIYFDHGAADLDAISGPLAEADRRLRENPNAKLFIELHRNTSETAKLDQARKAQLAKQWQHLGDRVNISVGKPVGGAPCATLRSNDPAIFLPIRSRETTRDRRVDQLSIDRSTIAEAGVSEWSVVVSSEGDTLVAYGNGDQALNESEGSAFSIPTNADRLLLHSYVIDRAGQRVDSYDTLVVDAGSAALRKIVVDVYKLLNLPSVPGETWSYESSLLDLIVNSITSTSIVEVTNLHSSALEEVTTTISKILDRCRARGILPRKIEALPLSPDANRSSDHPAAYTNAVRVKITTPPQ